MSKRANRSRQTWGPYVLIGSGLILLAVTVLWYWGGLDGTVAQAAYDPADVVYDRPIHGVHEMGPPANSRRSSTKGSPNPTLKFRRLSTISASWHPRMSQKSPSWCATPARHR